MTLRTTSGADDALRWQWKRGERTDLTDVGGRPCRKANGSVGFSYRDRAQTADGIESLKLRAGDDGQVSIGVKGRGANLGLEQRLFFESALIVELRASNGRCWQMQYDRVKQSGQYTYTARRGQ